MFIVVEGLPLTDLVRVTAGRGNGIRLSGGCLLTYAVPDYVDDLFVVYPLEYAVAPDQEEVEVVLEPERNNLGLTDNYIGVTTISLSFSLNIAEGTGYREPAREHPQWPLNIQVFLVRRRGSLSKGLCSVNLTSSSLDAFSLKFAVRLVVTAQHGGL